MNLCGSRGFAGEIACVLDAGHVGPHKYGDFATAMADCDRKDAASCRMMRAALTELRDRLRDHPAYADLTEDEEEDIGVDTAELSYLVRIANEALEDSDGMSPVQVWMQPNEYTAARKPLLETTKHEANITTG
jgi:hypothetical protein